MGEWGTAMKTDMDEAIANLLDAVQDAVTEATRTGAEETKRELLKCADAAIKAKAAHLETWRRAAA